MLRKVLTILLFSILWYTPVAGSSDVEQASTEKSINIGYIDMLKESNSYLVYNGLTYPLYEFLDTCYIPLTYVEHMGATLEKKNNNIVINYVNQNKAENVEKLLLPSKEIYLNPQSVYMNHVKSYSLLSNDTIFIPVTLLDAIWDLNEKKAIYYAKEHLYETVQYVAIDDQFITNQSETSLYLDVLDILWDGTSYIEHKRHIELEPFSKIKKEAFIEEMSHITYMTTFIEFINGIPTNVSPELIESQKNKQLFESYENAVTKYSKLTLFFRPTHIKATLKYNTGKLKEGDLVTLLWAEKRKYYVVQDEKGREHLLPWDSLLVKGKDWYASSKATTQQIEDYANTRGLTSETEYFVWTDLARQRTYVLKYDKHKWKLEQNFVCATGKDRNPTPSGVFAIQYAIPYFGLNHGYRCKNALVFFRDYMYHSVIFDKTGKYITKGQLGTQVSSGCIRLSEADSRWLYKNIPLETSVWIH